MESSKNWQELDELAKKGAPLPKDLSPPEILYFLSVRQIYGDYAAGRIDRETAVREKREILLSADGYQKIYTDYRDACEREQTYIRLAGSLRADLIGAESREAAFDIALRLLSAMTGEETTEKIVREKWR